MSERPTKERLSAIRQRERDHRFSGYPSLDYSIDVAECLAEIDALTQERDTARKESERKTAILMSDRRADLIGLSERLLNALREAGEAARFARNAQLLERIAGTIAEAEAALVPPDKEKP